jgi:hypothetical protein
MQKNIQNMIFSLVIILNFQACSNQERISKEVFDAVNKNMEVKNKQEEIIDQSQIGVIIARFQVHKLHEGHINLIDKVIENHKKVINTIGKVKHNEEEVHQLKW